MVYVIRKILYNAHCKVLLLTKALIEHLYFAKTLKMRNYILIKMKGKRITKNLLFEYLCFDKNIRKGSFADRQKLTACTVMNSFWLFNAVVAPILSDDLFKIEGISTRQKGKKIPQACFLHVEDIFCSFNDVIAPYILKSKSTLPDVKTVH